MRQGTILQARYEIKRELGRGGQGTVYLAYDRELGREVAIKRLHPDLRGSKTVSRFKKEGEAMARLNHPHVVAIYDRFEEDGMLYQVMPYSSSGTLDDFLVKRRQAGRMFDVPEVIEIGKSLASALVEIHERGIVHRDVKLSNVFISKKGDGFYAQLGDFGVAHMPIGPTLTRTGEVIGTLAYLSPEQVRGRPAQAASDVYALGVVLYRLLTGRYTHAFGEDEVQNRAAILREEPTPVTTLCPDVPEWLAALLGEVLAKEAGKRPTAEQVYARLQSGGYNQSQTGQAGIQQAEFVPLGQRQYGLGTLMVTSVGSSLATAVLVGLFFVFVLSGQMEQAVAVGPAAVGQVITGTETILTDPIPTVVPSVAVTETTTITIPAPETVQTAVVTGTAAFDGLNLRAEPSTESTVLGKLEEGTAVEILVDGREDGWVQVQTDLGAGWVFGEYLLIGSSEVQR